MHIHMWTGRRQQAQKKRLGQILLWQEVFTQNFHYWLFKKLIYTVLQCALYVAIAYFFKQIYSQYLLYLSLFINIIIAVSLYQTYCPVKSSLPDIWPFHVGQCSCPAAYFQAWKQCMILGLGSLGYLYSKFRLIYVCGDCPNWKIL
jgi:hypothetical protein